LSTDDAEHIAQLERQVRELWRANAIVRNASVAGSLSAALPSQYRRGGKACT